MIYGDDDSRCCSAQKRYMNFGVPVLEYLDLVLYIVVFVIWG